ncbi:FxLD family lanthipeptide [Actinomadura geliboluensis]|uniref:FxLD family lantipeptide n=1 Tax=Actinomadura geliboluensis TaxID=882440 RepID=A0A5S4GM99_9ACTN|nr:FxLD family lanthipeptide [Actinomadura geliboluensis]TMR27460.1 FxLD family lantipeptide [Actinomadura geliboluensis]
MSPHLTLDATELLDTPAEVSEDEFVLDMRVVESTTPLVTMMCSTSDGCGSTCSTSACSTSSNDPA